MLGTGGSVSALQRGGGWGLERPKKPWVEHERA